MKFTIILSLWFLLLSLSAFYPSPANAGNPPAVHALRLGLLDHDTDGLWSGSQREDGTDFNAEVVFTPHWELLNGTIRPNLGLSVNDQGATSKIYTGGVWHYLWPNGLFFETGAGLAIHNGETDTRFRADRKLLGSAVLFRVAVEAGFSWDEHHSLSLMFDHVSNAYLAEPNEGMDTLGIRYGYRF